MAKRDFTSGWFERGASEAELEKALPPSGDEVSPGP